MFLSQYMLPYDGGQRAFSRAVYPLQVETTSGRVHGMINSTTLNVARYLGIPFSEPPVEDLRFRLPLSTSPGPAVYGYTPVKTGPPCPQYLLSKQTLRSSIQIMPHGCSHTAQSMKTV